MLKGAYHRLRGQIAQNVPEAVRLRHMDFLNIPARLCKRTKLPSIRHPGLLRAFRDIHVPKFMSIERNIKKISYDSARQLREHFVQSAYESLLIKAWGKSVCTLYSLFS